MKAPVGYGNYKHYCNVGWNGVQSTAAYVEEILPLATRWHVFPIDKDPYSIGERQREGERPRETERDRAKERCRMLIRYQRLRDLIKHRSVPSFLRLMSLPLEPSFIRLVNPKPKRLLSMSMIYL